ncbi:MAG: hypothetical protein OXD01_06620 [Gammaproteobacteria bacterium]|nr:hypothetical protein [Gammaproteobacteria bacterium]
MLTSTPSRHTLLLALLFAGVSGCDNSGSENYRQSPEASPADDSLTTASGARVVTN